MEKFSEAILDATPPPCIKPNKCSHWDVCAKEKMACGVFGLYVGKKALGIERKPSKEIYEEIYDTTADDQMSAVALEQKKSRTALAARRLTNWHAVRHAWMMMEAGAKASELAAEIGVKVDTMRDWIRNIRRGWWFLPEPRIYILRATGRKVSEDDVRRGVYKAWMEGGGVGFEECLQWWARENNARRVV